MALDSPEMDRHGAGFLRCASTGDHVVLAVSDVVRRRLGTADGSPLLASIRSEDRVPVATALAQAAKGGPERPLPRFRPLAAEDAGGVLEGGVCRLGDDLLLRLVPAPGKASPRSLRDAEEELRHTCDQLLRANAQLERFAYVVSQDLKEPARMVSIYTDLLARRVGGDLDLTAQDYLYFAVTGAQRIKDQIDDLLSYARVGAEEKHVLPVPLDRAFAQAFGTLVDVVEETAADITAAPLPEVPGNPPYLVELFRHLLDNALKFRQAGRPPRIQVTAEEDLHGWHIAVSDNGIGIEGEYLERIFEPGRRLHTWQEYPGNGMGLTICRRIADYHGGRLWAESVAGEGSTFIFFLPGAPAG